MTGPRMKPKPMPAPMRPMPLARSSGAVTSAMYAWATAMFAVETPLQTRATKSMASEPALPSITMPTAEAAMLPSRTVRRPVRSERWPQNGTKSSCANA